MGTIQPSPSRPPSSAGPRDQAARPELHGLHERPDLPDLPALARTIDTLTDRLLARRAPGGHWEGWLASSALATAVASIALVLADRATRASSGRQPGGGPAAFRSLATAGIAWLATHQNADGGWGDTTASVSNVSTTSLCWAALSIGSHPDGRTEQAMVQAESWLRRELGGDLTPGSLRRTLLVRYGRDLTFSVPILTVLAIAGRLGTGAAAWRRVPQLPFELAVLPHRWFRLVRLPVVSYALPALVAMGHVRHRHAPSRNPLLARLRHTLRASTLRVARGMQPHSGGYLEATPLTAFVVMSLIEAGQADDPIVTHGLEFLVASARPDGSWPIDTNLATWVTTLSVDALDGSDRLSPEERARIREWLLGQQMRDVHPFTKADPGGWAWTDLSGGVPDADDTAGALVALRALAWVEPAPDATAGATTVEPSTSPGALGIDSPGAPGIDGTAAAITGLEWLLGLQNSDGGIPTFCRGWGALPFDRSAPDLTAHAMQAWTRWSGRVPVALQRRLETARARALAYLARQQAPDGSWLPLWFGNQAAPGEHNPVYGTARVVTALALVAAGPPDAPASQAVAQAALVAAANACLNRGVAWLLAAQHPDGGWGGAPGVAASIEETGVALCALAQVSRLRPGDRQAGRAIARGAEWLIGATAEGRETPAAPIGLYFARLWYDEELYPLIFALTGLREVRRALTGSVG